MDIFLLYKTITIYIANNFFVIIIAVCLQSSVFSVNMYLRRNDYEEEIIYGYDGSNNGRYGSNRMFI